jgi:hypothetical protein
MKPVMLYTLPRTRATALFYACRRAIIKDEVFANFNLDLDNDQEIKKAFYKIDDPNTVLKIHGPHIARSTIIEEWYKNSLDSNTYEVFVVERLDRLNTFLSLIIAQRFGYNKRDEILPFEFSANDTDIELVKTEIENYFKYYPTCGSVINLENYPTNYFDSALITTPDQESYKKYHYIKNYDWIVEQLQTILADVDAEWQGKIDRLNEKNN